MTGSRTEERSLTAEVIEIGRKMIHAGLVDDALEDVVRAAKRTVPGCSFASFSVRQDEGGLATRAATDPEALILDHLQYHRDGPSVAAVKSNETVLVADLASDDRWPGFATSAARVAGCVLVATIPDETRPTRAIGSLNIYGSAPNAFDDESSETAALLAAHVAVLISMATTIEQLQFALQGRDIIGQAKGILMERQKLTAEAAFDVLRRSSQRMNLKLRDVAAELTARTPGAGSMEGQAMAVDESPRVTL
ncbi:MAG TPA: GAF and ANTAR domain-containing protein [Acidimicrobiales bacterium]|nr:GAF and ANTAR domain-containing protein [Acidimicrobiales bacterium]